MIYLFCITSPRPTAVMGYGGILEPYWLGLVWCSTSVFYNSICISVCIFICTKSHVTFLVKKIRFTDARPQLTDPNTGPKLTPFGSKTCLPDPN